MRNRARSALGIVGFSTLSLLCSCGHRQGPPAESGAERAAATAPALESTERCMIRLYAERDMTEVLSEVDGYGLLLPGTEWALRCEDDAPLVGSAGLLRVKLRQGEAGPIGAEQRLRKIHERFVASLGGMGLTATAPVFEKVGNEDRDLEKLVMTFEVSGGEIDRMQTKSVHAWSAIETSEGKVIEYHASWTGSQGAWREGMLGALRKLLLPFLPLSPPSAVSRN